MKIFFGEIDNFIEKQAEYIKENNPQSEDDNIKNVSTKKDIKNKE